MMQFSCFRFVLSSLIFPATVDALYDGRFTRMLFQKSFLNASHVDFQPDWIHDFGIPAASSDDNVPAQLRAPNFLPTFVLKSEMHGNKTTSIERLASEAKQKIVKGSADGVILFRGLHRVLKNVSDFGAFWSAMQWDTVEHISCYNRKRQRSSGGVDFVDTDVPWMVLGPHNEHACNPIATGSIAFYGLQPASVRGGESLIRFNADIHVPEHVAEFIRTHGGIQTIRIYDDHERMIQNDSRHPTTMSWQERCMTHSKTDCIDFFADRGMPNATFDENHTLTVISSHSGWLDGNWFNHIEYCFPTKCADGTAFPIEWQMDMKRRKWNQTFAYKLQQGDWLVMDNRKVQHGRLPYEGNRQLIVTYTK